MDIFVTETVAQVLEERPGLQRLRLSDDSKAYVLTNLLPAAAVGDQVVVNVSAVGLGLGTGGWHVVHWNLSHRRVTRPVDGHVMKMRYTSLQVPLLMAEETYPEPTEDLQHRLSGRVVLVAGLHSQIGVSAIVMKSLDPSLRLGYVMTDGAALPVAFSDLVYNLRSNGLLDVVVSSGHAFGGDREAVNVISGVAAAFELDRCDVVLVGMGPGVVGTGTVLGNSTIEVAEIVNSLTPLGCRTVVTLRASDVDARPRHTGISHHSLTSLTMVNIPQTIAIPDTADPDDENSVEATGHLVRRVNVESALNILENSSLTPSSMGRGLNEDRKFYAFTAATAIDAINIWRRASKVEDS